MTSTRVPTHELANQQGATALLAATFDFLRRNNIADKAIVYFARQNCLRRQSRENLRSYRRLMRTYEDMGVLMAIWFSQPQFLDKSGCPMPLTIATGPHSVANLVRASRVRISLTVVLELMRKSPSIRLNTDGTLSALRRVFVLSEFKLSRAAFVVERYLDTLRRNSSRRKGETTLLVERSCHVSGVDLRSITPILRDIEGRGAAFMDSIDGEIESCRVQRTKRKGVGELGVLIFAWTRPRKSVKRA
jgi:hypothetical protein